MNKQQRRHAWEQEQKRGGQMDDKELENKPALDSFQVRSAFMRLARLAFPGESDANIERELFPDHEKQHS
jgi:hypothetical protein